MKPITEFTVKRSEWYRGRGDSNSELLIDTPGLSRGKKCCLGFYALNSGLTESDIAGKARPDNVKKWDDSSFLISMVGSERRGYSEACSTIMAVNDDSHMTDESREKELKKLFAEQNITINFED